MKKILVTGAGGFIGSHLVEKLLKSNNKVKAFIKYNSSNNIGWLKYIEKKYINNLTICMGDIKDYESVENAISDCNIIYNLAAMISVQYSFKYPQSFLDTNVYGLMNLLRAANKNKKKIKKIIQVSSSEVYGNLILDKKKKYLKETDVLIAESPYAASKIAADNLTLTLYKNYGLPITIARPFNTYGPRQSMRAIIPTIIAQLVKDPTKPITLGNLDSSRDFVFVEDTVEALIYLSKKGKNGETYNISNGKSHSIKSIIKIMSNYLNIMPIIKIDKKRLRNSDVHDLVGDNTKIKKIGWKSNYSSQDGFKKGLIKTTKWIDQNKDLYFDAKKYHL
jgi:GDP-mannose 4,6-dehydratase